MLELFDETFWNERYGSQERLWSGNPNVRLVEEAADLPPGTALDIGCGEGADAIWLASRGWQVTGTDISTVALDRAAAHAGDLTITWLRADLLSWTPRPAAYDLVSAHFMQLPPALREPLFSTWAAAVSPGGSLLIVGHHPSDMHVTAHRPDMPELFYTADDVAALLNHDDWEIVTNTAPARTITDPDGNEITFHDAVLRARRKP